MKVKEDPAAGCATASAFAEKPYPQPATGNRLVPARERLCHSQSFAAVV